MPRQPAIPGLREAMKKKVTRRERFLAEMEAVVLWGRLLALIGPHYPKAGPRGGRPPMPLETMLRVYFLQNWYALSDPMVEETLYDSEAMRRFAGIELGDDRIPDETTILNFRHLLERHGLTEAIFAAVNAHLADKGITLRSGSLVDATIIDAPSSTKNKARARDPDMSSTKKGNDWYFGMKAHVGVDGRCCTTLVPGSRVGALAAYLGGHEQALTCPLPHDELVRVQRGASQARLAAGLAGSRDGVVCSQARAAWAA